MRIWKMRTTKTQVGETRMWSACLSGCCMMGELLRVSQSSCVYFLGRLLNVRYGYGLQTTVTARLIPVEAKQKSEYGYNSREENQRPAPAAGRHSILIAAAHGPWPIVKPR